MYVSGNHGGFYKASKLASEVYLKEFNKIHGLRYCILRYGTFMVQDLTFQMVCIRINKRKLKEKENYIFWQPEFNERLYSCKRRS